MMRYSAILLTIVAAIVIAAILYSNSNRSVRSNEVYSGVVVEGFSRNCAKPGGLRFSHPGICSVIVQTRDGDTIYVKVSQDTRDECWKLHTISYTSKRSDLGTIEHHYVEGSCRPK